MASCRTYPDLLEGFWLQQLEIHFEGRNLENSLLLLQESVQKLSDLFTTDRPDRFFNYCSDPEMRLAYGLYFFPQSFVRANFPLLEAIQLRGWTIPEAPRILDLGAGPGACGFGAGYLLGWPSASITAIDHSPEALHFAERISRLLDLRQYRGLTADFTAIKSWGPKVEPPFDLIIAGFSLNEAFTGRSVEDRTLYLESLAPLLAPDGLLLVLEPALLETAVPLQAMADSLLARGSYYSWGPYLHQGPCPMLEEGIFWNHEVRTWDPPESLQILNRHLYREIHELKFSYCLLGKKPPTRTFPPDDPVVRLVSPLKAMKGRILFSGVNTTGEKHTYEIMDRSLRKSDIKKLIHQFERGDIVRVHDAKPIGDPVFMRIQRADQLELLFHPD